MDVTPRLKTLKVVEPPKRSAGVKVPDFEVMRNLMTGCAAANYS
jgi:hypothetical protein